MTMCQTLLTYVAAVSELFLQNVSRDYALHTLSSFTKIT